MPGRTVIEVSGARRILREYDDGGRLVKIRVEPLSFGPTSDLPPVTPTPRAPKADPAAPQPRPEPPATLAAPEERPPENTIVAALRAEREPAPEDDGLPVTLEAYDEPAPAAANPYLLPAAEPVPPPAEATPAPPPAFEIVRVERVAVVAEAVPVAAPDPEPLLDLDPLPAEEPPPALAEVAEPEPPTDPDPFPATEPDGLEEPVRDPEPVPEVKIVEDVAPLVEAAAPEPAPRFAELVPDVDSRVDALLRDRRPRKRRARLAVPFFPPLAREPWESRLDEVLGRP